MFNRCKRRSLLILFFLIQFLLFSTYLLKHFRDSYSDDSISSANPVTLSPAPDHLPASLIEKSERILLKKNYKNPESRHAISKNDSRTYEQLDRLNVSFIKENNSLKTVVQCSIVPPNLTGRVAADLFSYEMHEIESFHSNSSIRLGGHWTPVHCTSRYRVAIIIPYRDRDMQLRIFLNFMHPFLQKQQLDYQIFLVEPIINVTFNRALLFNIGFREAMKHYAWECFIFHDVDLLPEDDRNIYSCPTEPRHMSVAVNTMNYQLPYRTIFGGVSALTVEQFKSVNGFSNQYFGWGGEDDDMAARILRKYRISRYPASIARYKMLRHRPDTPNQSRFRMLSLTAEMLSIDGLSNLQYEVVETRKEQLYTLIQVNYNETLIKSSVAHIQKKPLQAKRRKSGK